MMNLRLAVVIGLFVCLKASSHTDAAVIEVRPVGELHSVADAIAMAKSNDTVLVHSGTYQAFDISVDKPLVILGRDWPTLDAHGKGQIMEITASGVTITGLHFRGVPTSFIKEHAAIRVTGAAQVNITANRFSDNFFAVYLAKSERCTIADNQMVGAKTDLTSSGNGVHLWYCHDIAITNNTVTGHRDGIYLEFATNSSIVGNQSERNLRYGLHFMYSDSCHYERNRFLRNGAGVAVMYTHHVEMIDNDFQESWGGASYGLLLKDIRFCNIINNRFSYNSTGVYAEGADFIRMERNRFVGNGWAIKIMANCQNDTIMSNDFVDNSFQVATNSRQANSTFVGNYWSTYRGYDLDRDGFGEEPFRPVNLYSLLVESDPSTLIFIRSLLVDLLDLAERVVPTLTPQALIDPKPSMRPVT
jgi:nitrous oxidase accessory protein